MSSAAPEPAIISPTMDAVSVEVGLLLVGQLRADGYSVELSSLIVAEWLQRQVARYGVAAARREARS